MEKIWLKNYPPGVPAEINPADVTTLVDLFETSVEKYADKPAFTNMGLSITYRELDEKTRAFADYLQHGLGMASGDRVAIMMPNCLQYPVALFGTLRAGMTVVNVNPLYTARELRHQLKDSGATTIVVLANFASTLERATDVHGETSIRHIVISELGDMLGFPKRSIVNLVVRKVKKMVPAYNLPNAIPFRKVLSDGNAARFKKVDISLDSVAFLQYTGGTTGVSKGAILTHRIIGSNVIQAYEWIGVHAVPGEEVIVTALPLYHIFALTANCLTYMRYGANNLLITNPRDFDAFIKEIKDSQLTAITGVNTLFNALIHHPDIGSVDFSNLRMTLGGGMAVQGVVAEKWKQLTGKPLLEAYGLTETSPAATINPLDMMDYNGSIGLPVPSTEVRVNDPDGKELPVGEIGELCIRGPQVMSGYWQQPEETAKVLSEDGWLRTGDMARIDDDGFVYIVDRIKDMIVVSGFNVYPNEIEEVISTHPGVLEVAAIGVADERSSEAVKVFIVSKDPELTAESVLEHARENLTAYKIPKYIEFREELPKTNVGKILRRALREEVS